MVRLGDIFKITSGGTPSKSRPEYYEGGNIQWVRTGDLKGKFITSVSELITEDALENSSAKLFPINTVLVAMYGATIGACSILAVEAATNQACAAFLPNKKVTSSYLYYFLRSKREDFIKLGVGGAQPNISGTILKGVRFPLPPMEVQQKIAQTLDAASELIALRKTQLAELDNLIKSTFYDMFGDPERNPHGWIDKALEDIADITSGVTKGRKLAERNLIMVPYMRVANVQDGHLVLNEIKEIEVLPSDVVKYRLLAGDLLMTEGGDPDKLGRCAIWNSQIANCIHQNHIFRVRLKQHVVLPQYLCFLTGSQFGKKYFLRAAKQTTGIATINSRQLKKFPIPLPPLYLQTQFAEIVTKIEEQKDLVQKAIDESQYLFDSLMSEYFD